MIRLLLSVIFIQLIILEVASAKYTCFNETQSAVACRRAKSLSVLPNTVREMALEMSDAFFGSSNAFGRAAFQVIISQLSKCPIDTTNDKTLAKSFNFHLYYPDERQENLTGVEFMRRCSSEITSNGTLDNVVYLWHGFLVECPSISGLKLGRNFGYINGQILAKKLNAIVIVINWGASRLSCCNYLELTFCYLNAITKWMANRVIDCAKNDITPSIENTIFVGHSLGAQFSGHTCQKIFNKTGKKCLKVTALDPAGPFYSNDNMSAQCQGIMPNVATQTMAIYTNPGSLGTNKFDVAQVNIFVNKNQKFCQHNVTMCDPIRNHVYSTDPIFHLLAVEAPLRAIYLNDSNKIFKNVTFYGKMTWGRYDLEATDNAPLRNPSEYYRLG